MDKRIHKNKKDYGITDYRIYYNNKYNKDISKSLYNKIITDFNNEIKNMIINNNLIYKMPSLNLEILIKKEKRIPIIKNGKLINNIPPDWKKTNALWAKDPEAKEKKILVRYNNSHTSNYIYRIYCKKFNCNIKNKNLIKFKPNRTFQRDLAKRIKDKNQDNLNAYLLY